MNKPALLEKISSTTGDIVFAQRLQQVMETCEAGLFTNAAMGIDREMVLENVLDILERTEAALL